MTLQSRGTTFITFRELVLDTNWIEVPIAEWGKYLETTKISQNLGEGWMLFKAEHSATIELLEPDVIRRRMQFRPHAVLAVTNQMIRYEDEDYEHELTINEDEQLGRKK